MDKQYLAKDIVLEVLRKEEGSSYEELTEITKLNQYVIWAACEELGIAGYAKMIMTAGKNGGSFLIQSTPKGIAFIQNGGFTKIHRNDYWTSLRKSISSGANLILTAVAAIASVWAAHQSGKSAKLETKLEAAQAKIDSLITLNNRVKTMTSEPPNVLQKKRK